MVKLDSQFVPYGFVVNSLYCNSSHYYVCYDSTLIISNTHVINKIFEIRGYKVMLDSDLADLYNVETKRINEQIKRNRDRFPEDFMFQLTHTLNNQGKNMELVFSYLDELMEKKSQPRKRIGYMPDEL